MLWGKPSSSRAIRRLYNQLGSSTLDRRIKLYIKNRLSQILLNIYIVSLQVFYNIHVLITVNFSRKTFIKFIIFQSIP